MSKKEYRSFFANVSRKLKMRYYLDLAGIPATTFSRFMKSEQFDFMFSVDRLSVLRDVIIEDLSEIIA